MFYNMTNYFVILERKNNWKPTRGRRRLQMLEDLHEHVDAAGP